MNVELHVSPKHKMLVVPRSKAVADIFPDAQELTLQGKEYFLIKHHPAEAFLLRNMGFTVPAPILTHYDWPGNWKPFEAQKQTAALITMNSRCYVLNGMGTGKTSSALWAWDYLNKQGLCGKLLVVCPLSTMKFTWLREIFNTLPDRKGVVLWHASKAKRIERLHSDADILIVNHDGAKLLHDEIVKMLKDKTIGLVVLDELAVYRNGQAQRTKMMIEMVKHADWAVGMTGSPMPRAPTDVWAQCRILSPDTVPRYFSHFRDRVMLKINNFKYVNKKDAVETAFSVMQPSVRFVLDDITELPEVISRTKDIAMGKTQATVYKSMAAACYSIVGAQEITAANAGAAMQKLLQISCGWVYDKQRGIVALDGDSRLEVLLETIDEADRKVLVFVPFIHALKGISEKLTSEGIDHAIVSGATSVTERSRIFSVFQNTDNYKVLVAHPTCLAHGVTLTAANVIVWYSPVTSLEIYEQANARIRRIGQKHKQLVLHLQSTVVEKKLYKALQEHQKIQDMFLDLFADETNANPIE